MSTNEDARAYQASWQKRFGSVLSFTAPKLVVIEDIYVGLLHKVLMLLFLVFIVRDTVLSDKHLSAQAVHGQVFDYFCAANMFLYLSASLVRGRKTVSSLLFLLPVRGRRTGRPRTSRGTPTDARVWTYPTSPSLCSTSCTGSKVF